MTLPTADNIDRLCLLPLNRPGAWRVSFRSTHSDACHQLYANGRLTDATDTPAQRSFDIHAGPAPKELAVLAVAPPNRWANHADTLPADVRHPAWVHRPRIPRMPSLQPGDVVELRHDHTTGTLPETTTLRRTAWPADLPHWGWGIGGFGAGGFGVDGDLAPGFGLASFGAGPFGFDADLLNLDLAWTHTGPHQVGLRTRSSNGTTSTETRTTLTAAPPPPPARKLHALTYDPDEELLTLLLTKD